MDLRLTTLRKYLEGRKASGNRRDAFGRRLTISAESHNVDRDGNVEVNFDSEEVKRVLKDRLNTLREHDLEAHSA